MKWLVFLLMLSPAFAQTGSRTARKKPPAKAAAAAPADKWPIHSIAVEGNHDYPTAGILAVAGLKIGEMAGKPEFEAASDRLKATGYFETVGYRFFPGPRNTGYAATFQVTEVRPLPVKFEQLGASDSEIAAMLRAKNPLFSMDRLPANPDVIDRHTKWISEYLASKGLDGKIAGSVTSWPDEMAIVFEPARRPPAVAEVTFEGNQAISEDDLRKAVAGAAVGAGYREERFRQILDASIRPVYEAKGYVRVAFTGIRTEPARDVAGLQVFVTVKEGEAYKLGKVEITGPSPLAPADLIKTGKFKTGAAANFDAVKEGVDAIRQAVRRAGYLNAAVQTTRDVHDADKTVDVAIQIDAGPQYSMGKLKIVGLDLEGEAEMRRIWGIKEGKPFNPEYPDAFLTRVRDEGMFDNLGETKSSVTLDDQARTVDVTLTFGGAGPAQQQPGRKRRFGLP